MYKVIYKCAPYKTITDAMGEYRLPDFSFENYGFEEFAKKTGDMYCFRVIVADDGTDYGEVDAEGYIAGDSVIMGLNDD